MASERADDARTSHTESFQSFGSQTPSSRARHSDTLFDHDSNVLLSPALSATTVNSRPVSGISWLPAGCRDSVADIVDDPFFQKLQDVAAARSGSAGEDVRPTPSWADEVFGHWNTTSNGREDREVPAREPGFNNTAAHTGHREDRGSDSSGAWHKRAPPRRESLIIGQPQHLSGSPNRVKVRSAPSLPPGTLRAGALTSKSRARPA